MTTQEYKLIAANKLNTLSTADLINQVKNLQNDLSQAAMLLNDVILDILMERMPESEFIQLCETI